jgi:hypothetical protein
MISALDIFTENFGEVLDHEYDCEIFRCIAVMANST